MSFMRQVSRLLDHEHRASITLLDRLGHALAANDRAGLQALASPLLRQLEEPRPQRRVLRLRESRRWRWHR